MRKILIPLTVAVFAATSSLALAAGATHTTTGTIKSYDSTAKTLTLQNGTVFHLTKAFPSLKTGERVRISWHKVKGMDTAAKVTIVKTSMKAKAMGTPTGTTKY